MDEGTKQALWTAIRSLIAVAGSALTTHGILNEANASIFVGALTTIIPIAYGVWEKTQVEKRIKAREVAAVNAGIAVASTGTVGETARPADVPKIIADFAPPTTPKEPT